MLNTEWIRSSSLIHHIDTRIKIIVVIFFTIVVAALKGFVPLISALILGFCILLLTRIPMKEFVCRLIPVNIFILFLWIFLPFSVKGESLFTVGPLVGTHEGILYASRISIRSNAIMAMLIMLVASDSVLNLGHAMIELKVPKKVVQLLFFTYRYVHVIYWEYIRLTNALKVRAFRPKTNLHTYKAFAYLIGMLLVRSSCRAERVYNAMLCRGFSGNLYSLSTFSLKSTDLIFLFLMFTLISSLGLIEWIKMI